VHREIASNSGRSWRRRACRFDSRYSEAFAFVSIRLCTSLASAGVASPRRVQKCAQRRDRRLGRRLTFVSDLENLVRQAPGRPASLIGSSANIREVTRGRYRWGAVPAGARGRTGPLQGELSPTRHPKLHRGSIFELASEIARTPVTTLGDRCEFMFAGRGQSE
jgi:hypothetical protein